MNESLYMYILFIQVPTAKFRTWSQRGIYTAGERECGAQRRKKKTKMKPKGTKRVPKNPKGAKREPKDAKRERQGDQNGSKNRLGRQGRFWKQKVGVAREFLGAILGQFSTKKAIKNRCKNRCRKT